MRLLQILLLFILVNVQAQQLDSNTLKLYEKKLLNVLSDSDRKLTKDSITYYTQALLEYYKSSDSLVSWIGVHINTAKWIRKYHPEMDEKIWLSHYDSILINKWREPKDSLEVDTLLDTGFLGGFYHKDAGDIYRAQEFYSFADELYDTFPIEDFNIDGKIRKAYANNLTRLGQIDKAKVIHQKMLNDALGQANNDVIASHRGNLSIVYEGFGHFDEAIAQCDTALLLDSLTLFRRGYLKSLLASFYLQIEDFEQAQHNITEAIRLLESSSEKDNYQVPGWLVDAYGTYGKILLKKGELSAAEKKLKKAIRQGIKSEESSYGRGIGKLRVVLGQVYIEQGKFQKAIEIFNLALNSVIKDFEPNIFYENPEPSLLFEENTIIQALAAKSQALKILYLKNKDLDALKSAAECHELAYVTERKLIDTYQTEFAILELQSASRIREGEALDILYLLYEATQSKSYLHQAFQTAEQSKSSVLGAAIQNNLLKNSIAQEDSLFLEIRELKSYVSSYKRAQIQRGESDLINERLIDLEGELRLLQQEIRRKYPKQADEYGDVISVREAASILHEENDALIAFFQSDTYFYRFLIDKNANIALDRVLLNGKLQTDIQDFVFKSGSRLSPKSSSAFYGLSHRLYQILLPSSIKDKVVLNRKVNLTIIPDGLLNDLSFDALLSANYTNGEIPFLIRNALITYAFSTTSLFYQNSVSSSADKSILGVIPAFAGSKRLNSGLDNLNFAESEFLFKDKALLSSFYNMCQYYKILHLSTHAQAEGIPSIEFIDSTLFLAEIYGLPIQADLVFLDACETALGNTKGGEGLMSLARAFTYAGSTSLIATLWKVNNNSTSKLVANFYEHLANGKTKAEALRQAKLDYLAGAEIGFAEQRPYYWSSMTFVGADGKINLQERQAINWWMLGLGTLVIGLIVLFFQQRRKKK